MDLNDIRKKIVLHYWHGKGSLWQIFWLYGVLGNAVLIGLFALPLGQAYPGTVYPWFMLALILVYNFWCFFAIWRCAFNTELALWGYLARTLVVFIFLYVLLASFAVFIYLSVQSGGTG